MNKFDVTGKIQVLGEPLTKLKLSTQVKAVHEENETRTHDDSPSSEVGKIVEFDNTEVDIKFTQPWDYDISSSPAIKYEQTYTAEET